ncbi:Sau3AI family type II restriction endonuclease [Solibacillus sp. FSL R7-0668]|uniref:Sau3AI family type II restriction endonuclease n=1 Tax=Solibacillus sp. FSL R7-0668 TaxID=2921688 RepID=UPI0030F996F5
MLYKTSQQLLKKAKEAENKTFRQIDQKERLSKILKGGFGHVIEESHFGYEINSNSEPDFKELGIELKVTAIKENKNGSFSAKERLVLNIINYMEEYNKTFETSSFWKKNQKLLLMFYKWVPKMDPRDYKILEAILYEYPEEDLIIIRRDWERLNQFINEGKAHLLTEKNFEYLSPCTKGVNKNSMREQPFSEIKAKQRAYSFKSSYMTSIIREMISLERLTYFSTKQELQTKTIEQLLNERFAPYIGMKRDEMASHFNISVNPKHKSFVPSLVSALLGVKGTKLDSIAEFAKANIQFKTVRLKPNGKPKESMSFVNIDFHEVIQEEWEDSFLYNYFSETKLLFVIFQIDENDELYFKGIQLWQMPEEQIDNELFHYWTEIRRVVNEGVKLTKTKKGISNNLPDSKFNGKFHVRPKGKDSSDKVALPDGQMITKQCYWFNAGYVANIISGIE